MSAHPLFQKGVLELWLESDEVDVFEEMTLPLQSHLETRMIKSDQLQSSINKLLGLLTVQDGATPRARLHNLYWSTKILESYVIHGCSPDVDLYVSCGYLVSDTYRWSKFVISLKAARDEEEPEEALTTHCDRSKREATDLVLHKAKFSWTTTVGLTAFFAVLSAVTGIPLHGRQF